MKLTIKVFAIIRDTIGSEQIAIEVQENATVSHVLDALVNQYPQLGRWKNVVRIAVNREYVLNNHIVAQDDEIAVIPPVSGG